MTETALRGGAISLPRVAPLPRRGFDRGNQQEHRAALFVSQVGPLDQYPRRRLGFGDPGDPEAGLDQRVDGGREGAVEFDDVVR